METENNKTNVMIVTFAIFIATFMTAIEGTIVSTAMPTIVGSLHGMAIMNWVFAIYLLTNAMTTPIYGKLTDRIGRKPIFIFGTIIFIIGSSLCGLSQNMLQLIIFRAIQGVGAGAIMPVALTIIADIYPPEKRAKLLGINSAAWGIASIIGPLFGGFIVDTLSWHWIFLINVPIGLILILLIIFFLVEPKIARQQTSLDISGCLSLMGVLLLVLYGFQMLEGSNGKIWLSIASFTGSLLLFFLFIHFEKHAQDPVISLDLFKNSTFVVVNIVAALVSGFLIGIDVYMPMWMQGVLGVKAAMGGLALAPMSITWIGGSFLAGRFMEKHSTKQILQIGLVIILLGALLLVTLPITTPFWTFFFISTLLGAGFGITLTSTTVTAQSSVERTMLGVATSFNTLVRTLGQTIMVSIFGVALNHQIDQEIAGKKDLEITSEMMNRLVDPKTVSSLPRESIGVLKEILYLGLHHVYVIGTFLLVLALIFNQIQKKEKKKS